MVTSFMVDAGFIGVVARHSTLRWRAPISWTTTATASCGTPISLTGDLDKDGRLDLLVLDGPPRDAALLASRTHMTARVVSIRSGAVLLELHAGEMGGALDLRLGGDEILMGVPRLRRRQLHGRCLVSTDAGQSLADSALRGGEPRAVLGAMWG